MSRLPRVAALLALAVSLVLAPAGAALASSDGLDDFDIESFDAQYTLTRDDAGHAHLHVVETIVAVFPEFDQNKGFYRDIPEYRHGVQLHTSLESVVDADGDPVPYTTEYYQDFFSVGLGDDSYVHGRQTYVITYDQVDVIESFSDTRADEFYWDVNGTGWSQRFGRTSATLQIDPAIAATLTGQSACYPTAVCTLTAPPANADGSVTVTAQASSLDAFESLTVAIGFTPGTFVPGEIVVPPATGGDGGGEPAPEPSFWDTAAPFLLGGAAPVLGFIAAGTQVADRSRRAGAEGIIVPQYTPPKDLDVMLAAYIAGRPERAFAAQIVDLAVQKKVRILDDPADSSAPFEVELVDPTGLTDLENQVARAVFGETLAAGTRVALGGSNTTLGSRLLGVYRAVDAKLKAEGYQGAARPTVLWGVLCVLSVLLVIGAGVFAFSQFMNGGAGVALSAGATVVAFLSARSVFAHRSTVATLSPKGREQNDYLLGMRDYMQLAEADRIRVLQSPDGAERVNVDDGTQMVKLYERLLPYAVIFGIEKEWSHELSVRAAAAAVPVEWWSGSSDLSGWRLNNSIQLLRGMTPEPPKPQLAKAQSTSSSGGWWNNPSSGGWGSGSSSSGWSGSSGSSFSGGSFGGGFSGGGGGGGGGRGR